MHPLLPHIPAKAGIQDRLEPGAQEQVRTGGRRPIKTRWADLSWIPAFAGMSGGGT